MSKRRPLFPPAARRHKLRNKGTDLTTRLTLNGPVSVKVRRWRQEQGVSQRPGEQALGLALGEASVGFRELACDLAVDGASSFARQSRLMHKWGMGPVSDEKLRQVVEAEGQRVLTAQHQQSFALDWQARRGTDAACNRSLVCMGVDGVMTRQITDQEKCKRRQKTAGKRAWFKTG